MVVFFRVPGVPVHSVLLHQTRAEALTFPSGDVELAHCRYCGSISNVAYLAELQDYSGQYESTQGYSPTFSGFHRRLALDLIERYGLRGRTILEIGSGQGEFLTLLCELGDNRGVGFDPAYRGPEYPTELGDRVAFVSDYFSESYADHVADFVCCKMTLEHIPNTSEFVSMVRRSLGARDGTMVFFQVPDVRRILHERAFWDIYYEHCSYFSLGSLARLFRRSGFKVVDLWLDYDDQYIMLAARPSGSSALSVLEQEESLEVLAGDVADFAEGHKVALDAWREFLRGQHKAGKRAVLWGGGSKAVAFLTALGVGEEIQFAVDINPIKHGTYLAGSGHPVVAPESLLEHAPDLVLVMNPIYVDEIGRSLAAMGLSPELLAVGVWEPQYDR
jgi:SAM-dependent methyltransferase